MAGASLTLDAIPTTASVALSVPCLDKGRLVAHRTFHHCILLSIVKSLSILVVHDVCVGRVSNM